MQAIFFISVSKPLFYPTIDKHYTWIGIHGDLTFEILSEKWHEFKPLGIYTWGDKSAWGILSKIFFVRKRWVHLSDLPTELNVCTNVFSNILGHKNDADHPLMSIITTTFNSGSKILRPFRSLRAQSYQNWEWIIWDDSKDKVTYDRLLELQKTDLRIRVFKAPMHSGVIGEMKRIAAGMAYGSFIIEVDHDDDFHKDLLLWIKDAGDANPQADFFYTDCAELVEDIYTPVSYGDFVAFGYKTHINVWSDFHKCYLTPLIVAPPNPVTLTHSVGVPNHVRVWRTEFYDKIGKHNPQLSVADDYELILRSFIYGTWCHIRAVGYYQYRNRDGNFTFIRNSLIQHNVKNIYSTYKDKLPKRDPEDRQNMPRWKTDEEFYDKVHIEYIPPEYRYDIVVALFDPSSKEIELEIDQLNLTGKKFHIFVVGELPDIPDSSKPLVSWWNLSSTNQEDRTRLVKKFYHICGDLIIRDENKS